MNILLVSESFILREYMENLFHEIIKDAQINVKIRLSETTKEDRQSYKKNGREYKKEY